MRYDTTVDLQAAVSMRVTKQCLRKMRLRFAGATKARYHVGDTPMDLQAADGAGARGVGVTTGIFSRDELAAASPGGLKFSTTCPVAKHLQFTFLPPWHRPAYRTGICVAAAHTDCEAEDVLHEGRAQLRRHCRR